jgi:putative ABC transport system permease protein
VETTNIRLNGVSPDQEFKTVPLLPSRIIGGQKSLNKGEILVPELLARGMKVNVGDTVVIVATNKDGSVNGKQFRVSGFLESVSGPGAERLYPYRRCHGNPEDGRKEISEVALRLRHFGQLNTFSDLKTPLGKKQRRKPILRSITGKNSLPSITLPT